MPWASGMPWDSATGATFAISMIASISLVMHLNTQGTSTVLSAFQHPGDGSVGGSSL